jgi:hypothetical protein
MTVLWMKPLLILPVENSESVKQQPYETCVEMSERSRGSPAAFVS